MDSIITYLLLYIQYLLKINSQLIWFIAKYIPLKQWAFEDSHSPEYQKFKVDNLPQIIRFEKVDYQLLLAYYQHKYGKTVRPVNRRSETATVLETTVCHRCGAPHQYIYDNNGNKGQYQCKVCSQTFNKSNHTSKPVVFTCPYCGQTLSPKKDHKHFRIHKCVNSKCCYYLRNLAKLPKDLDGADRHKYKLHYIYREFTIDFFKMDLHELSSRATNFKYKKFNAHIMGLCLTYHVNLKLFTRQTAHATEEVHGIKISHIMVANFQSIYLSCSQGWRTTFYCLNFDVLFSLLRFPIYDFL